jgi:hypothetical protein
MKLCFAFIIYVFVACLHQVKADTNAIVIEKPWSQFSTSNFVLYTDASKENAALLVDQLEVFAASLKQLANFPDHAKLPRLTAFKFTNEDLYSEFVPHSTYRGFYFKDVNGPIVVMGASEDFTISGLETVFHEYVHYFTRAIVSTKQPVWYSEGIADFFSTLKIEKDNVSVGAIPFSRFQTLKNSKLLDLETLFNINTYTDSNIINARLYASAWLVTHFMMLSQRNDFPDYNASMSTMLNLQSKGMSGVDAFNQAFDISLGEFKSQLTQYARKRDLNGVKIPIPDVEYNIEYNKVSAKRIYGLLSLITPFKPELNIQLMTQGMALQDNLATAKLAAHMSSQAITASLATPLFDLISEDVLNDPMALDYLVQAYGDQLRHIAKNDDMDAVRKLRNRVKKYAGASYKLQAMPRTLEALVKLAWQDKNKALAIKYANELYALQPLDEQTNFFVGSFMIRANNIAFAKYLLGNVVKWSGAHNDRWVKAEQLLATLENT